jgi:signal transduction histidine kinase
VAGWCNEPGEDVQRSDRSAGDPKAAPGAGSEVEDLTRRSLRWLVLTSLVYRVGVTLPAVLLNRSVLGHGQDTLLLIAGSVVALDGVLIVVAIVRPTWLATKKIFFVVDMLVAVAATFAATLLLPAGLFLVSGADLMTAFGWGTVGLWTAVRGWRTGLCLVIATPVLQLLMAWLNEAPLDASGVGNVVARTVLAALNYVIPLLIYLMARRTARTTVEESLRAGELAERADSLRALHDTALAALDGIALIAPRRRMHADERLALISHAAERQVDLLRQGETGFLDNADLVLMKMIGDFADRGLSVRVTGFVEALALVDREVQHALLGAVGEALHNTSKYAGVAEAEVKISAIEEVVEVAVCDHGIGLSPDWRRGYGLRESVEGRVHEIGGSVRVLSEPGCGTTVTLRVDRTSRPTSRRYADNLRRWFPLAPLSARLLALPLIYFKVKPLLAGTDLPFRLLLLGITIGHVLLIIRRARHTWRPSNRVTIASAFCADIMIAASLYLLVAADERANEVLTSDGATAWIYVFLTAPLWFAFGYDRLGMLAACVLLTALPVGMVLNDVPLTGGAWVFLVLVYTLQVVITAAYAALVVRMARRGLRRAASESDRAGRAAARLVLMTELRPHLEATFAQMISATKRLGDADDSLTRIKESAEGMALDIRRVLQDDTDSEAELVRQRTRQMIVPASQR